MANYTKNILKEFPGVTAVTQVPFHPYDVAQRHIPRVDHIVQNTKIVSYSGTITLTTGSVGDVLGTFPVFLEDAVMLEEVGIQYTAASGAVTTPGALTLRVIKPGDNAAAAGDTLDLAYQTVNELDNAVKLWNPFAGGEPSFACSANQSIRTVKMFSLGAYVDTVGDNRDQLLNQKSGSIEYPILTVGQTIQVMRATIGSGGTQTVNLFLRYREVLPHRYETPAFSPTAISF